MRDSTRDSTPDPLLEALGRQAREDLAALDVESADDPWAVALAEPLDDEFKASMVRRLQEERNTPEHEPESASPADSPQQQPPLRWPGTTEPPKRPPTAGWALAASLFVALALAVWIRLDASRPELPAFTLEVQGTSSARSPEPLLGNDLEVVQDGEKIRFRLRPEAPVEGELRIAVWVRDSADSVHPWPEAEARAELQGDGTIRVEALPWKYGTGEWVILIHVLRPGEKAVAPDSADESERWIETTLRVVP